jgi:hypothetical protein
MNAKGRAHLRVTIFIKSLSNGKADSHQTPTHVKKTLGNTDAKHVASLLAVELCLVAAQTRQPESCCTSADNTERTIAFCDMSASGMGQRESWIDDSKVRLK